MLRPNKMEVGCSVNNCKYWHDEYCTAHKLDVCNSEDNFATTSEGTCCSTFIPKV